MKNQEQVINHPSQLNALSVLPFVRTKGLGTILLGGSIAEHPQRKNWERDLNTSYHACGCHQGAVGLIIGLALAGAWTVFSYYQGTGRIGTALWVVLVGGITGAAFGKLAGLLRARGRLKHTIREIQGQWISDVREKEMWSCG